MVVEVVRVHAAAVPATWRKYRPSTFEMCCGSPSAEKVKLYRLRWPPKLILAHASSQPAPILVIPRRAHRTPPSASRCGRPPAGSPSSESGPARAEPLERRRNAAAADEDEHRTVERSAEPMVGTCDVAGTGRKPSDAPAASRTVTSGVRVQMSLGLMSTVAAPANPHLDGEAVTGCLLRHWSRARA